MRPTALPSLLPGGLLLGSLAMVGVGCSSANINDSEYWSPSVQPEGTGGEETGVEDTAVVVDSHVPDGVTPPPSKDCLHVEFTTISYGGRYSPRNVGAVWITDGGGKFVKTIEEWGTRRQSNLYAWRQSSGGNTVDAVTGATRSNAGAHSVNWNCTDLSKARVKPGAYTLHAEFVENNVSSGGSGAGPTWTEAFTVGTAPLTITPAADKAYTNKKVLFQP